MLTACWWDAEIRPTRYGVRFGFSSGLNYIVGVEWRVRIRIWKVATDGLIGFLPSLPARPHPISTQKTQHSSNHLMPLIRFHSQRLAFNCFNRIQIRSPLQLHTYPAHDTKPPSSFVSCKGISVPALPSILSGGLDAEFVHGGT